MVRALREGAAILALRAKHRQRQWIASLAASPPKLLLADQSRKSRFSKRVNPDCRGRIRPCNNDGQATRAHGKTFGDNFNPYTNNGQ